MKNPLSLTLIFFIVAILQCGKDETTDEENVLTELPSITEITFGSNWQSDSTLNPNDTGRTFSGNDTIYYQVKFDTVLCNYFMIKKVWKRNDTLLFSSVTLIQSGGTRICGELRHYDGQTLEMGSYKISILYYRSDTSYYDSAKYNIGVNRYFYIQ